MTDQELMQSIKTKYGAAIAQVCAASSVPPAFLAALIANESGGNTDAKRFEPGVLVALWQVLLGRKATYGAIGRADLVRFVSGLPVEPVQVPTALRADTYQLLDSLAHSWGLTQIMGYHCLEQGCPVAAPPALQNPETSLRATVWMLVHFAAEFHLDVASDFSDLLHCWNAGSPGAATFDPHYVSNAMMRMDAYKALP
jgi:Transglycosylase SLT domain